MFHCWIFSVHLAKELYLARCVYRNVVNSRYETINMGRWRCSSEQSVRLKLLH